MQDLFLEVALWDYDSETITYVSVRRSGSYALLAKHVRLTLDSHP